MRTTTRHGFIMQQERRSRSLSLEEVAARCGLHPVLVQRFVVLGIIDPLDHDSTRFAPEVTLQLRRALRLRRDLGVNYNSMALVLELLDRIETLERRLKQYERRLGR